MNEPHYYLFFCQNSRFGFLNTKNLKLRNPKIICNIHIKLLKD